MIEFDYKLDYKNKAEYKKFGKLEKKNFFEREYI